MFTKILQLLPITEIVAVLVVIAFCTGVFCQIRGIHRRLSDYIPSFMTALGILGTFIGIVIGLYDFDPENINGSIPQLLNGLKTAFDTSIIGMSGTILYKLLSAMRTDDAATLEAEADDLAAAEFLAAMTAQREAIENLTLVVRGNGEGSVLEEIRRLREDSAQGAAAHEASVAAVACEVSALKDAVSGSGENTLSAQLRLLREESDLANRKKAECLAAFKADVSTQLDLFIDKMSSAASDQMIEALREVIRDFNTKLTEQFGENFKHLNEAVEKLVVWQETYRTHVIELEERHQLLMTAFEDIKKGVDAVADKTKAIPETMQHLEEVLTLESAQTEVLKAQLESFAEVRDRAVDALPAISRVITESTEELQTSLAAVGRTVEDSVRDFQVKTGDATDSLKTSGLSLAESADEMKAAVSKAAGELDVLTQKTLSAIEKTADTLKKEAENILNEALLASQKMMEGTRRQIEVSVEHTVKETHDHIESEIKHLDAAMTRELENALNELASGLASIATEIGAYYQRAKEGKN